MPRAEHRSPERLRGALIAWLKRLLFGDMRGVPHVYAHKGTLADYRHGNRCLYCGRRDDKRRQHTDQPCERPHAKELA